MTSEKYVCSQCTGRTGEEHTFITETGEAKRCPYNGCGARHIQTIEEYLRDEIRFLEDELEMERNDES